MAEGRLRVHVVAGGGGMGGAYRATERIVRALRTEAGTELEVDFVGEGGARPPRPRGVPGIIDGAVRRGTTFVSRARDRLPSGPTAAPFRSRADIVTGLGRALEVDRGSVTNLHWLGRDTLSIREIGALAGPTVLTLHDMWAFCGVDHYAFDDRYVRGYERGGRPEEESGIDWNRRVWRAKARHWTRPRQVIAPSRWLRDCVRRSALMHDWPVEVIPYPIDLSFWRPLERGAARSALGFPEGVPVILFGAIGGTEQPIKGFDLLAEALARLSSVPGGADVAATARLAVFGGQLRPGGPSRSLPVMDLGKLRSDALLRLVYDAADVMVVPSRLDNLPQTAIEAQACGTPVVAFRVGGLPDIVLDGETGFLAEPFDPADLASALVRAVQHSERLGRAARASAERTFAPARIAPRYAELLRSVAGAHAGRSA